MLYDAVIIGGGPAGLSAALEVARAGGRPILIDENVRPGGQLFKQIHKFFGSGEHYAGTRGFQIGEELLAEARKRNVEVLLNTRVWGISKDGYAAASRNGKTIRVCGKQFILATGAGENALSFPGCTLPGVMTAGAAQTMANLYGTLPGKRIVMVGTGNVGLIVSYQLMQAGAQIAALLDVTDHISGYRVHAGKVCRAGVPVLLSHQVKEVRGTDRVKEVILQRVDEKFRGIEGTEASIEADCVCLAVGLTPRIELADTLHCELTWSGPLGGAIPLHSERMETSQPQVLIAGDLTGIEEASTALEEGRQAGVTAAYRAGLLSKEEWDARSGEIRERLNGLRSGPFGERRQQAKNGIWEAWRERMPQTE